LPVTQYPAGRLLCRIGVARSSCAGTRWRRLDQGIDSEPVHWLSVPLWTTYKHITRRRNGLAHGAGYFYTSTRTGRTLYFVLFLVQLDCQPCSYVLCVWTSRHCMVRLATHSTGLPLLRFSLSMASSHMLCRLTRA
jgi:hypothetical protein